MTTLSLPTLPLGCITKRQDFFDGIHTQCPAAGAWSPMLNLFLRDVLKKDPIQRLSAEEVLQVRTAPNSMEEREGASRHCVACWRDGGGRIGAKHFGDLRVHVLSPPSTL